MRRLSSSLYLLLVLSILLAVSGCQGSPQSSAQTGEESTAELGTPYTIGFLTAASGPASSLGEPERDVAVMIQEQLNAQGGIIGPDGIRHPVNILIYDTESDGDIAITLARKLINDDRAVAIVGTTSSPNSMAIIPLVQEAGVANISMASSGAIVHPIAERHWVFKVAQSNEHTSPWQVRYAKALGITRIANLYVDNSYGEDGAEAIRETARAEGIEIVLEDTFDATATDMTAQIIKIKASDAEAVLVTAIPPAAAIFTKQYRELGVDLPLIHNSGVAMKTFIDLAGASNVEGVVFPMGKLVAADHLDDDDPQKEVLERFVHDYVESSGKPPCTFAGHAWDALHIILNVLETLPEGLNLEEQRIAVRDGIENTRGFVGVDGTFNFSAEDHVGLSTDDVVLARIENGEWVYFPPESWSAGQ
ncbi:MAG TPA: ABC transporter substrate-binding protein [Chloroflexi bacterium]|jgi:branched-chain amino acid transport system substrate-binding protein|nr:ABC transporter substrate-binding protein [Chloroflexota bacterium]